MMELQGAIGLAQLAKLDGMIASQQKNKAILKEAASKIAGVSFREILDEQGDSATFLAFMLPDKEQAARVNQVLRGNQAGAINFGENSWHFYPSWEHLLEGKTLAHNGWPFDAHGKRRVIYDPESLPASVELMSRTLVYQVPVNLSEGQRDTLLAALGKAAEL
jgi:8-amino-3,8-dideoxy-alpha-D-manno-octulosonate transaminase